MKSFALAVGLSWGLTLAATPAWAEPAGLFRDAVIQAVETCRLAPDGKGMNEAFDAIGFEAVDQATFLRKVQGQSIGASMRPGACTVTFTTQISGFETTIQALEGVAGKWTPSLKLYDYRRPYVEDGRRGVRTSIGWQSPDQRARQRLVIHEPDARSPRPQYLIIYAWEG